MISATTPPRCKKPLPTIRRSSSPKAGCSSRATTPNWTNWWISSSTGENRVKALLDEEQKASGISKLKLGYNRVFGYYFELSKAVGGTPPEHFIRRQTLANAERFTTVRLKELEEKLLSAADRRKSLEYKLFQQLRGALAEARPRILFMADMLAQLDYCSRWRKRRCATTGRAPCSIPGNPSRSEKDVTLSSRASSGKPRSCPTIFIWMRTDGSC